MLYYKDNFCAFKRGKDMFFFEAESNSLIIPHSEQVFESTLQYIKQNKENQTLDSTSLIDEINFLFKQKQSNNFNTYKFLKKSHPSNKITLMLSQDCNLACKYCYGDSGRYGSSGSIMSEKTAKEAIDFLIRNNGGVDNSFNITFFGGEPLLSRKLIFSIFEYCDSISIAKSITFKYSITTNGTLLSATLIKEFKKRNVTILLSIDGPEEIHNKNRKYRNGKGTYNKIIKNINLLKKYNKSFSIRATVENENFLQVLKNIDFFIQLGAAQVHISNLSNYCDNCSDFPINIDEISRLNEEFFEITNNIKKDFIQGKNPYYIPFLTALNKIHSTNKSLISCGFMKGTTAVSTSGDLFPCHRFVGLEGFDFGNIFSGIDTEKQRLICKSLDRATIACQKCFAKYICARSCVRDIAKINGQFVTYPEEYCNLLRKNIVEYLLIYKEAKTLNPDLFNQYDSHC